MNISPRRRRRMQREHQLRQNGHTLEYIADKLKVSVATVHDDLRLLETNWDDFARATRHDLLLQQITRVNRRISQLINWKPPGPESRITIDEFIRIQALNAQSLNAANRELRLLLRELPPDARPGSGEVIEIELADYPDHELADPVETRKNLKKPESPKAAIPQKTQEISPSEAPEKSFPENLKDDTANLPRNTGRNKPCPCGSGKNANTAILRTPTPDPNLPLPDPNLPTPDPNLPVPDLFGDPLPRRPTSRPTSKPRSCASPDSSMPPTETTINSARSGRWRSWPPSPASNNPLATKVTWSPREDSNLQPTD